MFFPAVFGVEFSKGRRALLETADDRAILLPKHVSCLWPRVLPNPLRGPFSRRFNMTPPLRRRLQEAPLQRKERVPVVRENLRGCVLCKEPLPGPRRADACAALLGTWGFRPPVRKESPPTGIAGYGKLQVTEDHSGARSCPRRPPGTGFPERPGASVTWTAPRSTGVSIPMTS